MTSRHEQRCRQTCDEDDRSVVVVQLRDVDVNVGVDGRDENDDDVDIEKLTQHRHRRSRSVLGFIQCPCAWTLTWVSGDYCERWHIG